MSRVQQASRFRSRRSAARRAIESRVGSRRMLLESLEQRCLLAVSPTVLLNFTDSPSDTRMYGPALVSSSVAGSESRAEGEGASSAFNSFARQLLFAGIGDQTLSPSNDGLLSIIDTDESRSLPWRSPADPTLGGFMGGINGLVLDSSGRLFAAVDEGPCTTSRLIEFDPSDGTVLRTNQILSGATEISIGDLAIDPTNGSVYGTRSVHDDANHAGELFEIDVETGEATFIGDTGTGSGEGLAFASTGELYLAGTDSGVAVLYRIDPATGEPQARDAVTGLAIPLVTLNDPSGKLASVAGMTGDPSDGTLIATTTRTRLAGSQIVNDLFVIDPTTGEVTAREMKSPARGVIGDLAFPPNTSTASPDVLDIVFEEDFEDGLGGFKIDNAGGSLPGLWHHTNGRRFDRLASHTPQDSLYYGAFETAFGNGNYVLPLDHQGRVTSPVIELPAASVLSFDYLLDVRTEPTVDFVTVSVIAADGTATEILSRHDGSLPQTGTQQWRTATADLSQFACQAVQVQFTFDTGPPPTFDPEGWYIDDVTIAGTSGFCDYGDVPDSYGTLRASDGARHGVVSGLRLGDAIDSELDGQPTAMADGDDINPAGGIDDEDGVTWPNEVGDTKPVIFVGQPTDIIVELPAGASTPAFVDAWIDFNQDGSWDDSERITSAALPSAVVAGANAIMFTVPTTATLGDTFARVRLSSTGGLDFSGFAADGEVEDYKITIKPATDVEVDKSDNGNTAIAGTTHDYTIALTNHGPSDSTGTTIVDTLPAGWTFVASDNATCAGDTNDPQAITCSIGPLAAGASEQFTITVAVPFDATIGEVKNVVMATSNEFDPNPDNNMDMVMTKVGRKTDLAIVKSDNDKTAIAGTVFPHYELVVTNHGPSRSSGAIVTDTLPSGWGFVSSNPNTCAATADAQVVECSVDGLDPNESVTIAMILQVPSRAMVGVVTNNASVAPTDPDNEVDPTPGNNADTEDTPVRRETDLELAKRDNDTDAVRGSDYEYTLTVTNNGPSDSNNATVVDTLPAGWTFTASSNPTCSVSATDVRMITCTTGPLAVSATETFTITAQPTNSSALGTVTNQATAAPTDPTETDPDSTNNSDEEDTDVVDSATISGTVFNDVNGNTVQDSFEAGMAFVRVELFEDTDGDGLIDVGSAALNSLTTNVDGSYDFTPIMFTSEDPRTFIVSVIESTIPTGFSLTTGRNPLALASVQGGDGRSATFGYQRVVQFITPLESYRPDNGITDATARFVRPADDVLGDLLRDPNRDVSDFIPTYQQYQTISISNPSGDDLTAFIQPVISATEIATDDFVTSYTAEQLNRIGTLETQIDTLLDTGQTVPAAIADELQSLLQGVTQVDIAAESSVELFFYYRPVEIGMSTGGVQLVTKQMPDWSPTASPASGKAHTFSRNDHVNIELSDGSTLQVQLSGGSTYDSDVFDYDGDVDVDDISLVDAIVTGKWPTIVGETLWDPTTDANTRYPNGASSAGGTEWPDTLLNDLPIAREVALGDYGVLNVEVQRKSRAPFLDLDDGISALGVDFATQVAAGELQSGVNIVANDARFANALGAELEQVSITITNLPDGEDEQLTVDTSGSIISVLQNSVVGGQRVLLLGRMSSNEDPGTVDDFLTVLKTIRYSNQSEVATPGTRVIEIQATGTDDNFSFQSSGQSISQAVGNLAISRVTI